MTYLEFNSLLILKPAHPQNSNLTQDVHDSVEIPLAITVRERSYITSMLNFSLSYVLNNARLLRDRQKSFLPRVDLRDIQILMEVLIQKQSIISQFPKGKEPCALSILKRPCSR